jgi:hypothetical protein
MYNPPPVSKGGTSEAYLRQAPMPQLTQLPYTDSKLDGKD